MEKWSQCKTSSRTHLLSLKEPRALTCLGNWPHSLWKQCIPPMEDKSDCCKLQAQFISLFRSCSHSFFLNTVLFIYCEHFFVSSLQSLEWNYPHRDFLQKVCWFCYAHLFWSEGDRKLIMVGIFFENSIYRFHWKFPFRLINSLLQFLITGKAFNFWG